MTAPGKHLPTIAAAIRSHHEHVRVADLNDHALILAINDVPFPWHVHPASDELFIVLEGQLDIEFEDGATIALGPLEAHVVPAGVVHRTAPRGRCVNLLVERATTETRFLETPPGEGGR